ncbi:MAG: rod-binding protein [Vulcanimicrobiaceae bacterium]
MTDIGKTGAAAPTGAPAPLTAQQQQALKNLQEAATKFEGVFLQMLMSAMNDTVSKDSIFGKNSASEETWQGMLSDERAQAMAKSGAFGLAQQLEQQLRSQVLGNAAHESKAHVDRGNDL